MGLAAVALVGLVLATTRQAPANPARLEVRPQAATERLGPGVHPLGLGRGDRDGVLVIPSTRRAGQSSPLAVVLHGAGGSANGALNSIRAEAEALGVVLLIPDSRGVTWDAVRGRFGADVVFLSRALAFAFAHADVDPARVGIGGFSDGASYALSIGLANGDLFSRIFAFSPGFIAPAEPVGKPKIDVFHGTRDQILPIEATSRRLVPRLERQGYVVSYVEFDGAHTVLSEHEQQALSRLASGN
jgi:phospholipase/carboxylesterase